VKSRISAKEAAYVARESLKRRAIRLLAPEGGEQPPAAGHINRRGRSFLTNGYHVRLRQA
jgi:hypothetical protein